jgi:hypothetical protein
MMKAPCISLDMQGAAYVQGINPTASLWGDAQNEFKKVLYVFITFYNLPFTTSLNMFFLIYSYKFL